MKTVAEGIRASSHAGARSAVVRVLLSFLFVGPLPLLAQLVPDGGTRTLANVTNSIAGTVTVGTNGSFTSLTFSDNAFVTNSAHGVVGRNASAQSNEVQLLSATARWWMGGNLFVGSNGAFNRVVISDGALVNNNDAFLGNGANASNNFVLVTGGGSLWTNRSVLSVGTRASGNHLIISNGARVASIAGLVGWQAGSSNNLAVVTGNGTLWSSDVNVGGVESGNRLVIEAGGRVIGNTGYVGDSLGERAEALVTGAGSLWSNRADLAVGLNASSSRLVVSNGGVVVMGGKGRVGAVTGATNNIVTVTGAGSLWNSLSELYVGENGPRNRMEVSDGGRVVSSNTYIGFNGASSVALVTGAGSVWSNRNDFTVGLLNNANHLMVSNGSTVFVGGDFLVGSGAGSDSNSVIVTDAGTQLLAPLVNSFHHLGKGGSHNSLLVKNGARLATEYSFQMSSFNVGSNNVAVLTDPGSLWTSSASFTIHGNNDQLVVSNGAVLRTSDFALLASRGAQAIVTGPSSALLADPGPPLSGGLSIGQFGVSNRLVIEKGALVTSGGLGIGPNQFASDSRVIVTDPGSVLSNRFLVHLSDEGTHGNALVVSNGAKIYSGSAVMHGSKVGNGGCDVFVTGPGSAWSNRGLFTVGTAYHRTQLAVTDGGALVSAGGLLIGEQTNSILNRVVVQDGTLLTVNTDGSSVLEVRRGTNVLNAGRIEADLLLLTNALGRYEFNGGTLVTRGARIENDSFFSIGDAGAVPAVWDVRAGLDAHRVAEIMRIGVSSPFAQLLHTNGALLTNSDFVILGVNETSRSNTAVLSGPSSRWQVRRGLAVGGSGSDNRLLVTEAASLSTLDTSFLGIDASSTNNEAVVQGPGASWTGGANGVLQLGAASRNNRFIVADGGSASYGGSIIGLAIGSSNNVALITGAGSLWNLRDELRIGESGPDNQLIISNGAAVLNGGLAILGADMSASRNSALLTGTGSTWLINSNLFVGSNGALCQLTVTNGATVTSEFGTLGVGPTSSNNFAAVTGLGSRWTVTASLQIGRNGPRNQLLVDRGARLATESFLAGLAESSSGNAVLVRGAETLWSNVDDITIGGSGGGNRLAAMDGGRIESRFGTLGSRSSSRSNEVVVSGPGSLWRIEDYLALGSFGGANRVVLTNGGRLLGGASLGSAATSTNNEMLVTGAGTSWTNFGTLEVGISGSGNRLIIRDGAEVVLERFGLIVGVNSSSTNNRLVVDGGNLRLRSDAPLSGAIFDLRRGSNVLNSGLIEADHLLLTNAQGFFEFNGGQLALRQVSIANGRLFRVGDGVQPATFRLTGDTNHAFGAAGVVVASNGLFHANGVASGALTVLRGGEFSPGNGIGRLSLADILPPVLQGVILMELRGNGAASANDVLQTTAAVVYGGSLVVTNLEPSSLGAGDRFRLFVASAYSGAFTSVTLPPLGAGLAWNNKLLEDGSIEVTSVGAPGFASVVQTGTNLIFTGTNGVPGASYTVLTATNVTLPLSNWVSLITNQFGAGGAFSFTNGISPGDSQRFFWLRTP